MKDMLVPKTILPEIRVFKLVTGDEIIAKIIYYTTESYFVHYPFILTKTRKGMKFSPMLLMGDISVDVSINKNNIVAKSKPLKDVLLEYEKMISSVVLEPVRIVL